MALKVVFCVPVYRKPHPKWIAAVEASVPLLDEAGIDHKMVFEVGCPYVSHARATMLRKALTAEADVIVFLDDDMSWEPHALLKLIETPGHVVSGAYRFKCEEERYMGRLLEDERGRPIVSEDGCVKAQWVPAGFLKVTKECVDHFMAAYPELVYGPYACPSVDLFNHGAHGRLWWGEDYAFSRRWAECGGDLWVIPDLTITHHHVSQNSGETTDYTGNYHQFLLRQKPRDGGKSPVSLVEAA